MHSIFKMKQTIVKTHISGEKQQIGSPQYNTWKCDHPHMVETGTEFNLHGVIYKLSDFFHGFCFFRVLYYLLSCKLFNNLSLSSVSLSLSLWVIYFKTEKKFIHLDTLQCSSGKPVNGYIQFKGPG